MKSEFLHESGLCYLNHGSYGSTPRRLLNHQRDLQDQLERHPVRFMSQTYPRLYNESLESIAPFFGTTAQNLAFVTNATTGVACVLQSLDLCGGDEILCTNHRYQAVYNSMAYQAKLKGARLIECKLNDLAPSSKSLLDTLGEKVSKRTKLIMIDAISSITAHAFDVKAVIKLARENGIPVMVDGAHSPGHHSINLDELGADFWTGNLHKWMCAPKGCALLYVSPEWQKFVHAPIPSHGYQEGWQHELAWMGTFDPTAWLCAPECLAQWNKWGGWDFVGKNIEQQRSATQLITTKIKGTVASTTDNLCIRAIKLPISELKIEDLYNYLQQTHSIDVFLHPWKGEIILRISAFSAYTEMNDFERLTEGLNLYKHE